MAVSADEALRGVSEGNPNAGLMPLRLSESEAFHGGILITELNFLKFTFIMNSLIYARV